MLSWKFQEDPTSLGWDRHTDMAGSRDLCASKNSQITTFLSLVTKNMQLNHKSHRIKSFATPSMVICSNIDIQSWAESPQWWAESTTDLLNSAEFRCSEENWSCSGWYPELIYSVGMLTMLAWAHVAIRSSASHRDWPKAICCSVPHPPQGLGFLAHSAKKL